MERNNGFMLTVNDLGAKTAFIFCILMELQPVALGHGELERNLLGVQNLKAK